jgi:hypothetical protein
MVNIFIGTPCFDYKVNANYVNTLLEFKEQNIDFVPFFLHDSLITRARNELITQFYEQKEHFTHLFWLDSDVAIPASGLETLLSHNVDVIAAPVPIKDFNPTNNQSIRNVYEEVKPYLYKAEAAATGCLLMSKQSVCDLVENADVYYITDESDRKLYNVFEVGIRGKQLMSEDWDICYKLKNLNYDVYVDSSFPVLHAGTHNYIRKASLNSDVKKTTPISNRKLKYD